MKNEPAKQNEGRTVSWSKAGVSQSSAPQSDTPSRSETGAPSAPSATGRSRPGRSTPPYNPGLQNLVEGKQAWSPPLDDAAKAQGFLGWHQRGYLPHYDAPRVTQFVTLRLVDSLPASRRSEWEHLLNIENRPASPAAGAPACSRLIGAAETQSRSQTSAPVPSPASRERRRNLEAYLDQGFGECWLRQPAIAELTEGALRFFDGQRYGLAAWVVMPNHLHLLVDVWETPLSALVKSWKDFSAREANKLLGRRGAFWEREYWDTLMEDAEHRQTAVRYIENNPTKAKLVREPKEWRWSSARWRDEYGRLSCAKTESRSQTGAPPAGAPASSRLTACENPRRTK